MNARDMIEQLDLQPHPEGGHYRETWRSEHVVPGGTLADWPDDRSAGTSILFLLAEGEGSALHRVKGDELWFWQGGDPLELTMHAGGAPEESVTLGNPAAGHGPQARVPGGWWQSARRLDGPAGWVLVGCVVVPGFDFDDFEMR